jgi:hypothetical protein
MTPIIIRGPIRWDRCSRGIAEGLPVAVGPTSGYEVEGPSLGFGGRPMARELAGIAYHAVRRSSDVGLASCSAGCW